MGIFLPSITKTITKSFIIECIKIIFRLNWPEVFLANLAFQKTIITHLEL